MATSLQIICTCIRVMASFLQMICICILVVATFLQITVFTLGSGWPDAKFSRFFKPRGFTRRGRVVPHTLNQPQHRLVSDVLRVVLPCRPSCRTSCRLYYAINFDPILVVYWTGILLIKHNSIYKYF